MSEWKETEIYPRVPINWCEHFLGDIGSFKNGLNFNRTAFGKGIPLINVTHLHRGKYASIKELEELKAEAVKNVEEYSLKIGDILFARSSVKLGGTGQVAMVGKLPSKKTCFSGFIIRYRIGGEIAYPEFLNYLLRSGQYREFFISIATGTSIFNLTQEILSGIPVYLPPLPEQRAIASVLSSLDDKIDLLHRQNKTLEAMTETLFRQWFVEEAEEGWGTGKLGDYGKIICGKTPSKKIHSYFGGNIPFIKIPDMHGKTFIFDTEDTLTEDGANSQQNKFLPPKSICVSCIATVGLVTMNALNSQTNQQINSIIPSKEIYRYFLYLKLATMKDELLAMASGGTATDNLNTGDFSNIEIIRPEDKLLDLFHYQVQPYFDKIFAAQTQIRTLTRLRDTLLPRLMSGEVRMKI